MVFLLRSSLTVWQRADDAKKQFFPPEKMLCEKKRARNRKEGENRRVLVVVEILHTFTCWGNGRMPGIS